MTDVYEPQPDWLAPSTVLIDRHKATRYPVTRRFGELEIRVDEGVFDPGLTNVSRLVLEAVDFEGADRVLDAFAGSGLYGLYAAMRGAGTVVAIDIAPAAIDCITSNAAALGFTERFDVRRGAVHETVVRGERFDLLLANPPLLPAVPRNALEAAMFDDGLEGTIAYVRAIPTLLAPGGRGYIVQSELAVDRGVDVRSVAVAAGLRVAVVLERTFHGETYRVLELRGASE